MSEEIFNNPCMFCLKSNDCTDKIMIKGLKKLIKEVAPGLKVGCSNYKSSLTTTPDWMNAVEIFNGQGVNL